MNRGMVSVVLTDDFCIALGKIVATFAVLESFVGVCVAALAHGSSTLPSENDQSDEDKEEENRIVGEILTSGSSFKRNVEMLSCLYRLRHPRKVKKLEDVIKMLSHLEDERNKVVHSFWSGADNGVAERYKVTSRTKGHKVNREQVPLADLQKLIDDIGAACAELPSFILRPEDTENST